MIEPLPKHEDEWAYYESEPLFEYVTRVSDMMGEIVTDINSDGSYSSTPHLQPFRFASDFLDGKIDTQSIYMNLYESTDIQDTLRAFGLDSSKFWYLCLFIKWRVDFEYNTAFVFPDSTKEKLHSLISEFEKLSPEFQGGKSISKVPATLSFKVDGGKTITIDDANTLTFIGAAIESFLEQQDTDDLITSNSYGISELEKVDLSVRTKIYLYHKYLSLFVSPLEAIKGIYASKDKSLLISRMIYVFRVSEDKKLYTDLNEKKNKQNQLKGYLSRYKPFKFWHY
jgi:hypothetical protein